MLVTSIMSQVPSVCTFATVCFTHSGLPTWHVWFKYLCREDNSWQKLSFRCRVEWGGLKPSDDVHISISRSWTPLCPMNEEETFIYWDQGVIPLQLSPLTAQRRRFRLPKAGGFGRSMAYLFSRYLGCNVRRSRYARDHHWDRTGSSSTLKGGYGFSIRRNGRFWIGLFEHGWRNRGWLYPDDINMRTCC